MIVLISMMNFMFLGWGWFGSFSRSIHIIFVLQKRVSGATGRKLAARSAQTVIFFTNSLYSLLNRDIPYWILVFFTKSATQLFIESATPLRKYWIDLLFQGLGWISKHSPRRVPSWHVRFVGFYTDFLNCWFCIVIYLRIVCFATWVQY